MGEGGGGGTVTNRRFRVNYRRREKKEHSFRRAAGLNGKYIALSARNSRILPVRKVEIAMTVVR